MTCNNSSVSRTLAARLYELLPVLPAAERRVARALLAEYPIAAQQSVAQVAERAQVSGPTVLRLARKLGFEGYPDLREAVWRETADRYASPLTLYPKADSTESGHTLSRADQVHHSDTAQLAQTVDKSQFDAVADLLADRKRRIFAAGGRFTKVIAEYLALHLEVLRPAVSYVGEEAQVKCLLDARRGDVLVLIDMRRYQQRTVSFGERARSAGMTVVLITDPWMSPLTTAASRLLVVPGITLGPFGSGVPAMAIAEALCAAVADRLVDTTHARMTRYDELWSHHGVAGVSPIPLSEQIEEQTPSPARHPSPRKRGQIGQEVP